MTQQQLLQLGMVIIFLGIIIVIIASFMGMKEGKTKISVVGILGFIPFGFGNDKKLFIAALILGLLMVIISIFLFLKRNGY